MKDWRLPEHRPEAFARFYAFHLKYKSHPGCVYQLLPYIADTYDMNTREREWLVWLNGNTQNVVTSLLLLNAAPTPDKWKDAVDFWNDNFKLLEWDTDRRHQKSRFGEATEAWFDQYAEGDWEVAGMMGWGATWKHAIGQPYMGRLSAWSMIEYARILLGPGIPDADNWMFNDTNGSRSHRNGMAFVAGYDSVYWEAEAARVLGLVPELEALADKMLEEVRSRTNNHPDVSRLTMESALCTYKSWHKPNRRYPNVYCDMMYNRIKKAEARFPDANFGLLWEARKYYLPEYLRLEDSPFDPGMVPLKQNHYLETGQIIMMDREWSDLKNDFNDNVAVGAYGTRKDYNV